MEKPLCFGSNQFSNIPICRRCRVFKECARVEHRWNNKKYKKVKKHSSENFQRTYDGIKNK